MYGGSVSPSPGVAGRRGEAAAGRVLDDRRMELVARAGIVSRAVNYLVLAVLVAAILVGSGNHEVDRRGAVEALAGAPLGRILLVLLCIGVLAYIAWQLLRAAARRSDEGQGANAGRRLLALATAVIYAGFLVTIVRVLLGSSSQSPQAQQDSLTARVMSATGGRILVGAIGVGLVVAGLALGAYAATRKFEKPLNLRRLSERGRRTVTVTGIAGQAARGLVFVIIGGFILSAAMADDASRSKGLDAALKTLAAGRFGALLLVVVALGFVAFGVYSLLDARYREDFSR